MRHFHRFSRAYRTWYKKAFFRYIILYRNGFKCQYRLSFNRLANKSDNFLEQNGFAASFFKSVSLQFFFAKPLKFLRNILMKCKKKDFLYLPFSLYRYSYRKSCTFCPILIYFQHSVVIHINR